MTTAHSPLHALTRQAYRIAARLKAVERAKISTAQSKVSILFAIVMDDKVLKIEMTWASIREMTEAGIAEFLLKQMRESRDTTH